MGFLVQSESPVGAPSKFRPEAIKVPMFAVLSVPNRFS
jgi:hypothetical protein